MAAMNESCSVCGRGFDVQFRYQMEERDGGFAFFCSQDCHGKSVRGEISGGVVCDGCSKRFVPELVSQVVRVGTARKYACSETCRGQVIAESNGARLGQMSAFCAPEAVHAAITAPKYEEARASSNGSVRAPITNPPLAPASAPVAAVAAVAAAPAADVAAEPALRATVESIAASVRVRKDLDGPRRLAIFNHKGGTGKTTTTVSIAAGLAARGLKVLLVDTDSQGNVGVSFGVKVEKSLYHVLVMGLKPSAAVIPVRPNLDLIASNETLAAAELYLAGRQNRDRVLRDRLNAVAADYDVVLLDCSPSLSLMNQNALVFAEGILVPVACDFLSLVGVRQVIKTVKNVNSLLHHPVQIYGVLPTMYDARARICRDAVDTLKQHFGERCFAPVRMTTKLKEAPANSKTIFEYAPDSNAAEDYAAVVDRIILGAGAASSGTTRKAASSASEPEDAFAATA